ncbi:MAG: hypothetical protein K0R31_1805 [Clostridiales bacterium]|nr:hypothetical protein [Clostridiales bacterium]
MESRNENLLLWEQRIKERVQNGLTVDEWCKENGTTKYQYYYWYRRIHGDQKPDKEVVFADVTTNFSNPDNTRKALDVYSDFQLFFKGIRVTVPMDFNQESLAGLMKVLQTL